ncbi:MAG: hypothetical protein GWP50_06720, partial [Proteobacteria bacterium]|nr:hypothetical protein [Pseudomonadota bacterium]
MADGLIANGLLDDASIPIGNLNDCADVVLQSLRRFNSTLLLGVDGSDLLWERAAELNIAPHASFSANKACRLLPTLDGHLALNMARTEDWSLLPAWLQQPVTDWAEVTAVVAQHSAAELLDLGRLMGLALSVPEQATQFSWRDDLCSASKAS